MEDTSWTSISVYCSFIVVSCRNIIIFCLHLTPTMQYTSFVNKGTGVPTVTVIVIKSVSLHFWTHFNPLSEELLICFDTFLLAYIQGVPISHGNSVTNLISSLLWISIVIPNFKSHNIIMSARISFLKTVNGFEKVSIMSPQDE